MEQEPERGGLSRRRLFTLGLAGSAALAMAGAFGRLFMGDGLRPGERALALTPHALHVAAAVVDALLPEEEGFPGGLALGVHQRLDEEAWASPPLVRDDFNTALMMIEHLPIALGFGSRFTRLPADRRAAAFDALLHHKARLVVAAASGIRQMVYVFYYADPAAWAGMGYEGPFVPEAVPPESSLRYKSLLGRA